MTDTAGQTASDQADVTIANSTSDIVPMVVGQLQRPDPQRGRHAQPPHDRRVLGDGDRRQRREGDRCERGSVRLRLLDVNGTLVGTTLRNVAQPVWMAKPSLFDDMLMTGPVADVDYGAVTSASIVITDAAHPLAAGLSGTVAVTTLEPREIVRGARVGRRCRGDRERAGHHLRLPSRRSARGRSTAAGCRLTSSAFQNGPANFTAAGWSLFEAAADYAASNCQA